MSFYRKNPLFASALAVCAVLAVGELWCIYERFSASRTSAAKLAQKRQEFATMAEFIPPPTREIATAIADDLARAQRALTAMQAELKGRGPSAERMHQARVPAARTDAYFDLATFVEKTRDLAKKNGVELRPDAVHFGFATHANEAPDVEHIAPVFHQRQIAQYLVESLIEAHPRALLSVKREFPLTKKERAERDEAAVAAAAAGTPVESATPVGEGPDFFAIDPRVSVRAPGFLDSTAFRLAFVGQTASLRAFLNRLASFELPVLVREVEVEPASADEATAAAADEIATTEPAAPTPASVVLTVDAPVRPSASTAKKSPARTSAVAPIVAKPFSRFTVIVEFIELVPPPAPPADGAAPTPPNA